MSAALTREGWLTIVAERYLWPLIDAHAGMKRRDATRFVRYSIGFPKGSRGGRKSVGQCWSPTASGDGASEIFISPILSPFDSVHTLLHELIHAQVGLQHKHRGAFKQLALAVGLTGQMTATVPGEALTGSINAWLEKLPAFPGAVMKERENPNKQTTRLIKCQCNDCGYTVRTTARWLEVGAPHCPEHGEMEVMS